MPRDEKEAGGERDLFAAVRDYCSALVGECAKSIATIKREFTRDIARIEKTVRELPVAQKGDRGEPGQPGEPGAIGPQGPEGAHGTAGRDGANGARGERGAAGERGVQGERGKDGKDGKDGSDGAGEIGPQGASGRDGVNGARGERGVDGAIGPQGERGEIGHTGPLGATGPQGERGAQGDLGRDGADAYAVAVSIGFTGSEKDWLASLSGPAGAMGAQGDPGAHGTQGAEGRKGDDGADAYAVAVSIGFTGSEKDWLASLRGEPGARGEPGPLGEAGPQGKDGAQGRDGLNGKDGAQGSAGELGQKGERGEKGERGQQGDQGIDGRDALDLNVIEAIEEGRSYPRGTVAKWRGGLVKAERTTTPVKGLDSIEPAGWKIIVDGFWNLFIEPSQEDPRDFVIRARLTSGLSIETKHFIPAIFPRGVHKAGNQYRRGDCVTWNGSMWIALRDTSSAPGPGQEDWTLSVKHGRDGKDSGPSPKSSPPNPVSLK